MTTKVLLYKMLGSYYNREGRAPKYCLRLIVAPVKQTVYMLEASLLAISLYDT